MCVFSEPDLNILVLMCHEKEYESTVWVANCAFYEVVGSVVFFLPTVFHLQKEESYEIGRLTRA